MTLFVIYTTLNFFLKCLCFIFRLIGIGLSEPNVNLHGQPGIFVYHMNELLYLYYSIN